MRQILLSLLVCSAVAGCGNEPSEGPPDVQYGHAECTNCGMIVTNERYAAAAVLPIGEPNRELIFDDINCLIEFERSRPLSANARRYVHDASSLKWLRAEEAQYVRDPAVHTPMGSGLQAFSRSSTTISSASQTYDQLVAESKAGDAAELTGK